MEQINYTHLNIISFAQLENWSSYLLLGKNLIYTQKYPFAKIGEFLKRNKTQVSVEDDVFYKRAKIRVNGNGISLRDYVRGKDIGTKNQFQIRKGQFLLSKIDARNGAFGVVSDELDNGIITGNFWTFDVDYTKINPHYLTLLTGTKKFQELSQTASVGTTNRNYLQEKSFLNFEIPLPSLAEQARIVNAYNEKIEQAKALEKEADDLEKGIEEYLYNELGIINNNGIGIKKGIQTIDFCEIDKWALDDIFNKNTIVSKKFKLEKLNTICKLITDGTHQTPTYYKEGVIFLSAKNVTKEVINWDDIKYVSNVAHLDYIKRVKPELDDILLAKNGTTGVAAIVDIEKEFSIYVSLALLKPKKELVFPKYLLYIINSEISRKQFFSRLIGIGVPNLHLGEIKEVEIPLPPIEKQIEISNQIESIKFEINKLKKEFEAFSLLAQKEFENEIFG